MAKYIVVPLSYHADKTQQMFKAGDIITDDHIHAHHLEDHIRRGYLRPYNDEDAEKEALERLGIEMPNVVFPDELKGKTDTKEADAPPAGDKGSGEGEQTPAGESEADKKADTPDYEAMTNKELKALLDEKKVAYDNKANKSRLIELLTAAG